MARVKMGFFNLSIPNQIERSRLIAGKMTANLNFPFPNPSVASMENAIDDLEVAYNQSRTGDSVWVAIMKLRRKDLMEMVRRMASYVQAESQGDEEKILSSGFDVVRRGVPLPPVGQVQNLRLKSGSEPGSIRVLWNKVKGSFCYMIEISDEGMSPESFELYRVVGKTRWDIIGLEPGGVYWVRISAVGCSGYGAPSAIAVASARL